MPISEKIVSEIKKLDATPQEKKLLIKILELEDGGLRNYTMPYEREINNYISERKDGGDQG